MYTFIALFITQFCFVEVLHASFREEDAFLTYGSSDALHIFIDPLETEDSPETQLRVRIESKNSPAGVEKSVEESSPTPADEFVVENNSQRKTGGSSSSSLYNGLRMNLNGLELTLNSQGHLHLRGSGIDPLKKVFIYSSLLLYLEDVKTDFLGIEVPMVTTRGSTHIDTLDMTIRSKKRMSKDGLTPLHNKGILKIREGLGIDLYNFGEVILDRERSDVASYLRENQAVRIRIKNTKESTLVLKNGEFDAQGDYGLVNEGILVQENSFLAWTSASRWQPVSEGTPLPKVNKGKWITRGPTVLTLPIAENMGVMEIRGDLRVEATASDAIDILDGLKGVKANSIEVTAKTLNAHEPRTYTWPMRLNILDTIILNADLTAPSWEVYVKGDKLMGQLLERFRKRESLYILPDEILTSIASFFLLTDFVQFSKVSRRARGLFRRTIAATNILTSKAGYAAEWREKFKDVVFEPVPREIRLQFSAQTKEDSVEVHFRDPKHLRQIVEETPIIHAHDQTYFIKDPEAVDYEELNPLKGELTRSLFVHVISDAPLKLTGTLTLPLHMSLPRGSNITRLTFHGTSLSMGSPKAYTQANALAKALETFDERLYEIRTSDAFDLFAERQESRRHSPKLFPDLLELCPNAGIITSSPLTILQKDYLTAKEDFLYLAPSLTDLESLRDSLPDFSSSIYYIDPHQEKSGIYSVGPLSLQRGFEISTEEDISLTGRIFLPDYCFKITSGKTIWCLGLTMTIGSLMGVSGKDFHSDLLNPYQKPEGLSDWHWINILDFWRRRGHI